jgi:hypothetical protein
VGVHVGVGDGVGGKGVGVQVAVGDSGGGMTVGVHVAVGDGVGDKGMDVLVRVGTGSGVSVAGWAASEPVLVAVWRATAVGGWVGGAMPGV